MESSGIFSTWHPLTFRQNTFTFLLTSGTMPGWLQNPKFWTPFANVQHLGWPLISSW